MCGRVTAALLLFLFLSSSAFAQCVYPREYSGAYRASYLDLALDGNQMWAATGGGVTLFDTATDPPRVVDSVTLPGVTRLVRTRAGVGYAAGGSSIYVLRRPSRELEIAATIDAGGNVNDLELSGSTLVAATSNGVSTFDAAVAATPALARYAASKNVLSVAVIGSTLYMADGDSSIEAVNLNTSSPVATLTGTVQAISLNVANGSLLASDGRQTDVFVGAALVRAVTIAVGSTSVAPGNDSVLFVAGTDRQLHALDVSTIGNAVELFEGEVIPSGGSINRVSAVQAAGSRLYVAGGDAGLTTFDVRSFAPPFAVRSYRVEAANSVTADDTLILFGNASGGLSQMHRGRAGDLTFDRTWARERVHNAHDTASNFLLSSSGNTLTYWSLAATTPTSVSTATLRAPITGAVFRGSTAFVVLEDGSLWSVDLSQVAPSPVRVDTGGRSITFIARSGDNIATAEVSEEGSTVVRLYGGGSFSSAVASATVPGATTTLALSGTRAAVFTFEGISVIDLPGGQFVLPASKADVIRDIAFSGSTLVAISSTSATIWNLSSRRLEKTLSLPAEGAAVHAVEGVGVSVATGDGIAVLNTTTASLQPLATSVLGGNKYYRKVVAGRDRLYLFDGRSVEIFDTRHAGAPRFLNALTVAGALDVAASDSALFVLSGSGAITQYTIGGEPLGTVQISAGSDTTPLAIFTVAGAPWVAISVGCVTTGCDMRTFVFDPATLAQTATISGGVIDVTTSGSRAYALFDLPRETRIYNISDPLRPAVVRSIASEPSATAIGFTNATVSVLGDRLYRYDENTLTKISDELPALTQRGFTDIIVDGACTLVTGRSGSLDVVNFASILVPGTIRSVAGSNGRYFILTDYSLETISRVTQPRPSRRRATQ
jgi:hypothetical protein